MDDNLSSPLLGTEGLDIAVTVKFRLSRNAGGACFAFTFAMAFICYLRDNGFKATYFNVSLPENTPNATRTNSERWTTCGAFESELAFSEASQSVPADETHYVVMDESQFW
jgi:hypothetical protein